MLKEVTANSMIHWELEARSQMILGYHPEWAEVTRGDYQRFFEALRRIVEDVNRGIRRTREDLGQAIGETWRPLLAERVGVDSGRLQEDILTAGISVFAGGGGIGRGGAAEVEEVAEFVSSLGAGGGGGGRRKKKRPGEVD